MQPDYVKSWRDTSSIRFWGSSQWLHFTQLLRRFWSWIELWILLVLTLTQYGRVWISQATSDPLKVPRSFTCSNHSEYPKTGQPSGHHRSQKLAIRLLCPQFVLLAVGHHVLWAEDILGRLDPFPSMPLSIVLEYLATYPFQLLIVN